MCVPERIRDGWLIRSAVDAASFDAVVDVTGPQAVLEVRGPGDSWRTTLSPRHADLLLALAEYGPDGMSAGELSIRLFGDADHQVLSAQSSHVCDERSARSSQAHRTGLPRA